MKNRRRLRDRVLTRLKGRAAYQVYLQTVAGQEAVARAAEEDAAQCKAWREAAAAWCPVVLSRDECREMFPPMPRRRA